MIRHFLCLAALTGLAPPRFQDPAKVDPESHKVVFEADAVRVLDVTLKAGGKSALHSHPDCVAYLLTDAKAKFTGSDGKTSEVEAKAGTAMWRPAETHSVENIGAREFRVLHFELKESKEKITPRKGEDPVKVSPDLYKVLLENHRVRVCEVRAKPGSKSPMHGHPDSVIYCLSDAKVRYGLADGSRQDLDQVKGVVMWTAGFQHSAEVLGDKEAVLLVVELKPSEK